MLDSQFNEYRYAHGGNNDKGGAREKMARVGLGWSINVNVL